MKPGTGPLAAVPPGGRGPLPRSGVEAVSCEDCYAGPQDSAGAERPSARKGAPDGTALVMARGDGGVFYDVLVVAWDDETGRQEAQVRCICFGGRTA